MEWLRKNWQLFATTIVTLIGLWAGSNVFAQGDEGVKLGQGIQVPMVGFTSEALGVKPPPERTKVTRVTFVRKGESCIEAFKRLGEWVSTKDCIDAAHAAGIDILWYRPDFDKSATIIVSLWPGDKVALYQDGNTKKAIIFPRGLGKVP